MTVEAGTPRARTAASSLRAGDLPPRTAVMSGRGWYVPDDVLTNADVAAGLDIEQLRSWVEGSKWCQKRFEEAGGNGGALDLDGLRTLYVEYVRERIGIRERRVVDRAAILERRPSTSGVFGSDLGARAAERALADAGIAASDVDMIICGTSTPDGIYPSTACEIHARIGATGAYAFDLSAACSSFAFGLQVARGMIGTGIHRRVLVVSAEYFTCGVNWSDPGSAFFWGDGAAAVVLEPASECGGRAGLQIVDTHALSIPSRSIRTGLGGTRAFVAGGTRRARGPDADIEPGAPDDPYFYQDGRRVFRDVVRRVADETIAFLDRNDIAAGDVRRFWFHQPSALFLGSIVKRLLDGPIEDPRVAIGYDLYGNTSSSGAPMCMARDEFLQPGDYGCMSVFGAGYSIGLALFRALGT